MMMMTTTMTAKVAAALSCLVRLRSAISVDYKLTLVLVHGQVTIIFAVSVCLFVCAEFFSAVFEPISIKLGHMLYVWV